MSGDMSRAGTGDDTDLAEKFVGVLTQLEAAHSPRGPHADTWADHVQETVSEVYPRVYSFLACYMKAAWHKALNIRMKNI
jgi:hypothetical protein